MTALVARQPLHPLSSMTMQRSSRRLSARLQEKDDSNSANGVLQNAKSQKVNSTGVEVQRSQNGVANTKKRKKGMSNTIGTLYLTDTANSI